MIVGSQAILGALPDAPLELLVSQEVDLYAPEDDSASDLVDGSIGEKSPFHESFGYYGHGVGPGIVTIDELRPLLEELDADRETLVRSRLRSLE